MRSGDQTDQTADLLEGLTCLGLRRTSRRRSFGRATCLHLFALSPGLGSLCFLLDRKSVV
jgi:hypothetical protein